MKKIHLLILTGMMFFIGAISTPKVQAQNTGDSVGFSVQAILPENQRTNATYFDLLVEPGQTQNLQVEIFNHEDNELTVQVTSTTASTNRNGLIIYEPQETYDESLTYPISELVSLEANTVTVPAGESRVVDIILDIPNEPFEGFLLGGLHFKKVLDDEEEAQSGVQIQNRYAYVIGLQVTENLGDIEPELVFRGIEPELVNYRTSVIAKIQNNQPIIIGDVSISAEVFEADGEEPIKTAEMESAQFAPNSTMDFVIDWENEYLAPGDYRLEMIAESGDYEWSWNEAFSITDEQSQISDDAVELERFSWLTPQLMLLIILILIIVIVVLVYRLNKNKSK